MGSAAGRSITDVSIITEAAPAKINLALHVRRRRSDGYHEIETLFAFLCDGDVLTVEPADRDAFKLTGPFADALAVSPGNLVTAARDAFTTQFGAVAPQRIVLDKRLPVASGIGGGSADAAAMLRVLARGQGIDLRDPALHAVAAGLGADVPACLLGQTAFATGIGTDLVAREGLAGTPVLLVNPGIAVSTATVFRGWDGVDRGALSQGDPLLAARAGRNDLEPAARAVAPVIATVIDALSQTAGVMLARMSGSGATCFALYETIAARSAAVAAIRVGHPDWWTIESVLA
jgi:4-diphosphocytidyl-2-C-methyl-D-erythritol kinase